MLLPIRRPAILLGCTGAFLIILFRLGVLDYNPDPELGHLLRIPGSNPFPEDQIYRLPVKADDGKFDWANVKINYPVDVLEPLPRPSRRLPKVQHRFADLVTPTNRYRQREVKKALQRCWHSYRARAWLQDELTPISGKGPGTIGGWGATLVDTLDTLWIAGLHDEFREAVDAVVGINFSTTWQGEINVFETTIRYLGGLLAAFDLSGDMRLLDKSLELAHMLYAAFDTPNRMPLTRWDFHKAAAGEKQVTHDGILSAEIGSLSLEFTRLSQITHEPRWYDAVARIMNVFGAQQNLTNLPGMWPLMVNGKDKDFHTGSVFTLGAMSDSLYEYLPKMDALLGGSDVYARMYREAMSAAIQHAMFRPMLPDNADVLISGQVTVTRVGVKPLLHPQGQHLVCFVGGMLVLGGRLIDDNSHIDVGRKLTDGCIWAYNHSRIGVMPETFTAVPCESRTTDCDWDADEWRADVIARASEPAAQNGASWVIESQRLPEGFSSIDDRRYILRPEAIESVFILYRVTGDASLQDRAWEMFSSIMQHTKTDLANAALDDVTSSAAPKSDSMESFWTAETLKYFYLMFSDPRLISLDDFVFNTEAHPLRRPSLG